MDSGFRRNDGKEVDVAFTTWAALKTQMLDDLARGSWRTESYQVGDMQKKFRTFKDFMEVLNYVTDMAAIEAGTVTSRVYAKQGGRD